MQCRKVNWGREKLQRIGSHFCLQREDRDGGRVQEKHSPPKSRWRERERVETPIRDLTRKKGKRWSKYH